MAAECLCCPCLNVKLYVKDVEARQEDDQLLSNLSSNAHDSSPRLAELVKPVEALHDFLISTQPTQNKCSILRCSNCSTTLAVVPGTSSSSAKKTLPSSGRIALSPVLLSSKKAEELKQDPSYSSAFEILIFTGKKESSSEPIPSPSGSKSPPISPRPSPQRTNSASRPRELLSHHPTLAAIHSKVEQAIRAHRLNIEKDIAALRRTSDLFAQRTKEEGELLAQRAGIVKGFGGPSSPSSPASSPVRPMLSPRRSEEASKPSQIPPDLDPSFNTDLANSLAMRDGLQRMEKAASERAAEIKKELEAKDAEANKTEEEEQEPPTPTSAKKVTFLVPDQAEEQPQLGVSPSQSSVASTASHMSREQDETMFALDEEIEEHDDGHEEDGDDSLEHEQGLDDLSAADQIASLEEAYQNTQPAQIRSVLSAANNEQTQKLRQLLGTDAPSHRTASKKNRDGRQTPLNDIFEATLSPAGSGTSRTSSPAFAPINMAQSVPIAIAMRRRSDYQNPALEQKTSVPDREALFVPPLRPTSRQTSKKRGSQQNQISEQLRQATEQAASMSLSRTNGFNEDTPTASTSEAPHILSSDQLFSPPSRIPSSSFRGPSSLTAAFAKPPPPQPDVPSASQSELAQVQEGFEVTEQLEEGEEPSEFVPPHKWKGLSRGSESLLSTSVRDLPQ